MLTINSSIWLKKHTWSKLELKKSIILANDSVLDKHRRVWCWSRWQNFSVLMWLFIEANGLTNDDAMPWRCFRLHYSDVIMSTMASEITSLTIVFSTVYSGADQRKHESSASLAFVRGIHRWPVNSPHKWPVIGKMFPFEDVIVNWPFGMVIYQSLVDSYHKTLGNEELLCCSVVKPNDRKQTVKLSVFWDAMTFTLLSRIILCMRSANESQRYNVTLSQISWPHTQWSLTVMGSFMIAVTS